MTDLPVTVKELLEGASRTDIPQYWRWGNALVIGVNHFGDIREHEKEARKLKRKVFPLDELLIEGTAQIIQSNMQDAPHTFEVLALNTFKGTPQPLDEGVNKIELAHPYGVRRDLYMVYHVADVIGTVLDASANHQDLVSNLTAVLEICKTDALDFDVQQTLRKILSFIPIFRQAPQPFSYVALFFTNYISRVRDVEQYGPLCQGLGNPLGPKIGIILGNKHASRIADFLEGKPLEQPPQWQDYVRRLESPFKELILKVEENL